MTSHYPRAAKKSSFLKWFLIVVGVTLFLGFGACSLGAYWLKNKAQDLAANVADAGGLVLVSPPAVVSELAGIKKDYVGSWASKGGSKLVIGDQGTFLFENKETRGSTEKYSAPIAAFRGNDIELKVLVLVTIRVTDPPKRSGSHWTMTADGILFER